MPEEPITFAEAIGVCLAMCQRSLAEVRALARVPGPQGPQGPPGRNAGDLKLLQEYVQQYVDGMLKAASVTPRDGGRTLIWSLGGVEHEMRTAIVLDRGVWRAGVYQKGDGVTLGGSFFIAQEDTSEKPEAGNAWRLAVKRGRDGRDQREDDKRAPEPVRFR